LTLIVYRLLCSRATEPYPDSFPDIFFAQPLFESNFLGYLRIIIEKGFLEGEEVCLSWNLTKIWPHLINNQQNEDKKIIFVVFPSDDCGGAFCAACGRRE
jgi:hypothetical protein